jgi:hypothetical protein
LRFWKTRKVVLCGTTWKKHACMLEYSLRIRFKSRFGLLSCWVCKCKNYMNRFVLKNTFIKVCIYYFSINIFYKNKRSNLCFGDRVVVLNDF